MKFVTITTEYGVSRIEILPHPVAQSFFANVQELLKTYNVKHRYYVNGKFSYTKKNVLPIYPEATVEEFIHNQTHNLTAIVKEIEEIGAKYPIEIDESILQKRNLETQLYLNRLHASFTTAHHHYSKVGRIKWDFNSDYEFTIPEGKEDRFQYLIGQINSSVHAQEWYVETPHRSADVNLLAKNYEILIDYDYKIKDCDYGAHQDLVDQFIFYTEEDYLQSSDSDEYDVWIGRDVLGKDFLSAYYDHDDPHAWDTTYNLGYSSKFSIDVSPVTRAQVIKSPEFQSWIKDNNIEYTPKMCGIPLGRVVEGKQALLDITETVRDQLAMTIKIE